MFLKSVEMFGFKSFADRTKIEFTNGISALLGPNGCGKSNVVDAIKWVLGEQSSKTLRAEKMEDVIFNGTEQRKPLNVVEVTLTLANDDNILPLDMPEISVKRRLFRNGDSDYFINSTPARLKEIRELFFDTGIGKSAYSIMEQGKIDQVLSNKPEERRYLFEEAASITKYKIRGAEADRKLKKTEDNMKQVDNILHEVKRSHDALLRQSEKTKQYRTLKEQIFEMELDIQLLRLKVSLEDQEKKTQLLEEKSKERDALKTQIDSINESLEENLDLVNTMELKLNENHKQLYGLEVEKSGKESQMAMMKERSHELKNLIEQGERNDREIGARIKGLVEQVAQKQQNQHDLEKRIEEIEKNISEFESDIDIAQRRIFDNDNEHDRQSKEILRFEQEQKGLQKALRDITDDIVKELDRQLKNYSRAERKEFEQKIVHLLDHVEIQLDGRVRVFEDAVKLESDDVNLLATTVTHGLQSLKDAKVQWNELNELVHAYMNLLPSFLDEFLSPEGIITKKRNIDEDLEAVGLSIDTARALQKKLTEENKTLNEKITEYRKTLEDLRLNNVRMNTQLKSLEDERQRLEGEISRETERKNTNQQQVEENKSKQKLLLEQVAGLEKQRDILKEREKALQAELKNLESDITHKNKDLISKEKALKSQMLGLSKLQSQVERMQVDLATLTADIKNIYSNFKEHYSRDLADYDSRLYEIAKPIEDLKQDLAKAKKALSDLGSVNLMAPEEYAEVKERFDFLNNQLQDLQKAKENLKTVTAQIEKESTELFLETYNQIKKNFHVMFRRLFGGGRGELRLSDSSNVLESGIEIFAQPPGKKLENIALLSGGERSLTAVALLFATYMVKPSPFCILDEIDAALDESNVGRFVSMLMEFGKSSQFIVITHNKKTVTGANTLLGVTMEESGISKMIAVRLSEINDN